MRLQFPDAARRHRADVGRRDAREPGARDRDRGAHRHRGRHAGAPRGRARGAPPAPARALRRLRSTRTGSAPVTDEFIARVLGQDPSGRNLDEAAVCVAVECGARESSRRGGVLFRPGRASRRRPGDRRSPPRPSRVRSLLVILPAPPGAGSPPPGTVIAGLPLAPPHRPGRGARRLRAGPGASRGPARSRVCSRAPAPSCSTPTRRRRRGPGSSWCPANVLPQARWLRALREMPLDPETLAVDSSLTAVVESAGIDEVLRSAGAGRRRAGPDRRALAAPARAPPRRAIRRAASRSWARRRPRPPRTGCCAASSRTPRDSCPATSSAASRSRSRGGWWARAITPERDDAREPRHRPARRAVLPVRGAACYRSSGSLLFLTHSILDGCDGELARLKFQESPAGARLDFWGDNLVHVAVFGCMAVGWSLAAASPLAAAPGRPGDHRHRRVRLSRRPPRRRPPPRRGRPAGWPRRWPTATSSTSCSCSPASAEPTGS